MNRRISNKKLILWLHLWPGLISAAIIFFVCITGTIAVYCDEIMALSAGDARFVKEVKETRKPAEELIDIIKKEFPKRNRPSYMVSYKDPERSVRFNTFSREEGLSMVYIDPYTGEILKDDGTIYFFYITVHLHNSFLLGKTGQWIIDIATIIFVLEIITGLYLWWPKKRNKKAMDAAFKIKTGSTKKRLNYDLHKVLGFYAAAVILLLSVTGLLIAFEPLSQSLMKAFGADTTHDWQKELPKYKEGQAPLELNPFIERSFEKYPDKKEMQIYTYRMDSSGYYMMRVANQVGLKSAQSPEYVIYDRFSGDEIKLPESALKHEKVDNAIWVLHMGNWMGQIGKFITFLGGLIATSLPVTGFYIWWGKRKKNERNPKAEQNRNAFE